MATAPPDLAFTGYVHPGIPLTREDLDAIKAHLDTEPWKSGYAALAADRHSQLSYTMRGPFAVVTRAPNLHLGEWKEDMTAIWQLALMWYFTGKDAYAQKAHEILLAWANTEKTYGGSEGPLSLGDYVYQFAGGADILRGAWKGWTEADTAAVKALFRDVYCGPSSVPGVWGPTNKGSLYMSACLAIAVFNDDQPTLEALVAQLRSYPSTGFQNTLPNGEHGETGRDQGHSFGHQHAMAFMAEVLWKQGIDVFSERDNRLLAIGEYYSRYNLAVATPFVPMGTVDAYYLTIGGTPGYPSEPFVDNILRGAYVLRKGLSAPYLERKLAAVPSRVDSFVFLKPSDRSTAAPLPPLTFPAASAVSTGLGNTDIGGAVPAGSGTYNNGVWTVTGAGTDIATQGPEAFHFVYRQVTGDFTIIARVDSGQNNGSKPRAGLMVRSDLGAQPTAKLWAAITPQTTLEFYASGWADLWSGSYRQHGSDPIPQIPYWVKIERTGQIIASYFSPDGTSWGARTTARYEKMGDSPYVGLMVGSGQNGTLITATFSHVSMTGGDGAAPPVVPAPPLAIYGSPGDGLVPLRWTESFGATGYKVKRATQSGGPYATLATVTGASYADAGVSNGATYYYVVSATSAAGEGANSPEEVVIPRQRLVNIAGSGTATASAENALTGGAALAFDRNTGTKWFNGNAGPTGWIQYDLGAGGGRAVLAYDVMSGGDVPGRDPKDWQFQGSSDGSSWTTLDTQIGQNFYGYRYFPKRYYLSNATAWRYYRLNITANNGDATGLQLSELSLLAR
jgi:regulation of enolase protein 1 (concanavalin A-like superfamily)